jgi:hypothetical protein
MRQELLLMQYHLSIFFLLGAIGLKFFFASRIFAAYKKGTVSFITCLILLAIFAGQMMCDLAWLNYLGLQIFSLSSNLWIRTISRIAWILNLIHYQAIAYLNENIFVGQYKLSLRQKFFCGITALFLILNFFPLISSPYEYYSWEVPGLRYAMEFYTTFFLILPSFFIALYRFRTVTFPFLIRKQNTVFIKLLGFFTGIDVLRFIFVFLTLNGESLMCYLSVYFLR